MKYQTDKVFLEDESGRIELITESDDVLTNLVTGVTIAVLGLANEHGQFQVSGQRALLRPFAYT